MSEQITVARDQAQLLKLASAAGVDAQHLNAIQAFIERCGGIDNAKAALEHLQQAKAA